MEAIEGLEDRNVTYFFGGNGVAYGGGIAKNWFITHAGELHDDRQHGYRRIWEAALLTSPPLIL